MISFTAHDHRRTARSRTLGGVSELDGRVIAIAGAAGGLGPAVAPRLAAAGAHLALTDVDAGRLDALTAELGLPEERVDARVVDLLDEAAARQWADSLRERFGRIDGLLHLVGGWRGGDPLATTSLDDYAWLHDLLVRTVQHASRAFFDALAASEHGRFVLVSSAQAQSPAGTNASYAATKAAAEAWTLALADSFAETAATANIVVVNAILTPQMREADPDEPYRTFTSAEDIAEAIVFLCSDRGQKMNGKRLQLHP
jgi:NAD(P)-dependent dehydrogenase (short-subunit alcohol dehydrogenase family)